MDTEDPRIDDDATLLEGLTPSQRKAVEHLEGPLLVLAAAGSGKTRVITRRVAYLVSQGIPPWNILALTFTNKAAGEMRERIHSLLAHDDRQTRGLTTSTFHALCARLLRRYADRAGLKSDYTIYDASDQAALMKRTINDLNISTSNFPPRSVLSAISTAKNELLDAAAYSANAGDFYSTKVAKIYEFYEQRLRMANAVDFDDLLVITAKLLRDDAQVRAEVQGRWSYLLIDEYQDTNHAQFMIASLIAGVGREMPGMPGEFLEPNVCVVGDPDQSIYAWRGADISNILEFEERYPGATVIKLGENFRSTAPILGVADTLIRNNKKRKHKDLIAVREGGEDVTVEICRDEHHESTLAVDFFEKRREDGLEWRDMAIFYRTNALSRVMEDSLRQRGIPYVIARGTAFYEREEIKNAIAYLRVVANQADGVALTRIVNTPTRAIGKTTLNRLNEFATYENTNLFDVMGRCAEVPGLNARATGAVGRFVQLIDELTGSGTFMGSRITTSLADLVERVIRESGLEKMYTDQARTTKMESDEQRIDNLNELVSSAADFEESYQPESDPAAFPGADVLEKGERAEVPPLLAMLRAYLESIALVADTDKIDPAQGAITLMTLHASKGLEFGAVAMVGLEEGLLPHSRALSSEDDLEEERRLCFVGVTRAMSHLRISCARHRAVRGYPERTMPSRFLEEFGKEHVSFSDLASSTWDEGLDQRIEDADLGNAPIVRSRMPGASSGGRAGGGASTGTSGAPRAGIQRDYPPGCTVRHPQFGIGTVVAVMGGSMARAKVKFRQVGEKTLILEHARLRRLDHAEPSDDPPF